MKDMIMLKGGIEVERAFFELHHKNLKAISELPNVDEAQTLLLSIYSLMTGKIDGVVLKEGKKFIVSLSPKILKSKEFTALFNATFQRQGRFFMYVYPASFAILAGGSEMLLQDVREIEAAFKELGNSNFTLLKKLAESESLNGDELKILTRLGLTDKTRKKLHLSVETFVNEQLFIKDGNVHSKPVTPIIA